VRPGLPAPFTLEAVDVHEASDDVLRAMFAVAHAIEREDLAEPPWVPEAEWIADLRSGGGLEDRADWLVRDATGAPAARAAFYARRTGENRHRAKLGVEVLPAHRRSGLGRHLLALVTEAAVAADRTVVQTWTTTGGPGAAFADAHGIEAEDELELNRLHVRRVDVALLDRWVARARERAGDHDLVGWDGVCPEDLRTRFAAVRQVMDTAPQTRDHVDEAFTVDRLDELERARLAEGLPWWTLCARHRPTGALVGYTEVQLSEDEPSLAYQGDTAVDPAHRDLGLGRWLKAAMLRRILAERPVVEVLDTYNAGSNDAMIAINRELGFRVVLRTERRRADLADLAARLGVGAVRVRPPRAADAAGRGR
jgi:ribosomal protein S18 acetylase RimI-like enzyme